MKSSRRWTLLWVAKQHGHSVEVMLRMYAAWLDGATTADIQAIKQAMQKRPVAGTAILNSRAAISSANAATNRARLIVIRPPESPEFGSRLAVGKDLSDSSLRNRFKNKVAERVGFEPTCRNYPTIRFRVGAVMTTSVPLRLT